MVFSPYIVFGHIIVTMAVLVTVWCFPDGAIGRRYILARTGNGAYSLVPDDSKLPGIPVQAIQNVHHEPRTSPTERVITLPSAPIVAIPPQGKTILQDQNSKAKEEVVTLALQGHDGTNGNQGVKGPPGVSGPGGLPGPPGATGAPGTCRRPQTPCDVALVQKLTERITQLEKLCFKDTKNIVNVREPQKAAIHQ